MDLRQIRYFIMVAEELSFSRAAERLKMAQPPLSQEIRKLEEELGVTLFHRTRRQVKLSDSGRVFLEESRRTLLQVDRSIKATQLADDGRIGHLTIGFVDSTDIVIDIIKKFRERFPKIHLVLREMTTEQQLKALYKKEIHIGFIRSNQNNKILTSEICCEESLSLVLPENHPLASFPKVPIHLLANEPFIMFPRYLGAKFYDLIISYFWGYSISLNVVQEAIQMHTIVNLVATGMGISVVPSSVESVKRSGIVYRKIQETTPKVNLYISWRQDEKSTIIDHFLTVAREAYLSSQSKS
ncbi:LysR substrate-binding domain-containing protein [Priestia megaterium]|uniref:LysR substrate-binding domain-containing protein n=1 Tax=Priestia megaterium TaxID=1404 RepID=UPI000708BBBD|nr:LysR substrate-binding domain-containing protein [Priestia megaterium]KRE06082.1 LysR family transcriptional regulator [Bacillus sp. Root239]MCM3543598.1 LysR substrate-binding domain-containing protein [Priestia megaterium]MEC1071856.1 LysR substrate-binding domain-containing protein [Priestia megaterium]